MCAVSGRACAAALLRISNRHIPQGDLVAAEPAHTGRSPTVSDQAPHWPATGSTRTTPQATSPMRERRCSPRGRVRAYCRSLIDAFVAQPHQWVLGVASQVSGDLLRAPPLREQLGDHFAQAGVLLDSPLVTTECALDRPAVGFERPVLAVSAAVAAQLPRLG